MASHQHGHEESNLKVALVGLGISLVWLFIVSAIAYFIAAAH